MLYDQWVKFSLSSTGSELFPQSWNGLTQPQQGSEVWHQRSTQFYPQGSCFVQEVRELCTWEELPKLWRKFSKGNPHWKEIHTGNYFRRKQTEAKEICAANAILAFFTKWEPHWIHMLCCLVHPGGAVATASTILIPFSSQRLWTRSSLHCGGVWR